MAAAAAAEPHPAAAAPAAAAAPNVFVAPPPTFWTRLRSLWIPTSAQALHDAERRTFDSIDPSYPFDSRMVPVGPDASMADDPQRWEINTLTIRNPRLEAAQGGRDEAPLVLLHGFGAGIGLWVSNYNSLASEFSTVHAIDMLGWGRSARVDFETMLRRRIKSGNLKALLKSVKPASKSVEDVARAEAQGKEAYERAVATIAEDFTVDSLERWRVAMGLERMTLTGHSMGGYLAAAYALKYPDRVQSLVLASPIGVPHKKELDVSHWSGSAKAMISLVRGLWWGVNVTPQSIVRFMGRMGTRPVSGYVNRRFASSEEELAEREANPRGQARKASKKPEQGTKDAPVPASAASSSPAAASVSPASDPAAPLASVDPAVDPSSIDLAVGEEHHSVGGPSLEMDGAEVAAKISAHSGSLFDKSIVSEYLYHICAQPGSGEFAFAKLFDQSGFAHKPLIESLPSISRGMPDPAVAAHPAAAPVHRVPITFLYGTHDWMDESAGRATAARIQSAGGLAQVLLVPRAGHQLFIDNPKGFLDVLKQAYAFGRPQRQQQQQQQQQPMQQQDQ